MATASSSSSTTQTVCPYAHNVNNDRSQPLISRFDSRIIAPSKRQKQILIKLGININTDKGSVAVCDHCSTIKCTNERHQLLRRVRNGASTASTASTASEDSVGCVQTIRGGIEIVMSLTYTLCEYYDVFYNMRGEHKTDNDQHNIFYNKDETIVKEEEKENWKFFRQLRMCETGCQINILKCIQKLHTYLVCKILIIENMYCNLPNEQNIENNCFDKFVGCIKYIIDEFEKMRDLAPKVFYGIEELLKSAEIRDIKHCIKENKFRFVDREDEYFLRASGHPVGSLCLEEPIDPGNSLDAYIELSEMLRYRCTNVCSHATIQPKGYKTNVVIQRLSMYIRAQSIDCKRAQDNFTESNFKLEEKSDKIGELSDKIERMVSCNSDLSRDNYRLRRESNLLGLSQNQNSDLSRENHGLRCENHELRRENSELRRESNLLGLSQNQNSDLSRENHGLRCENHELRRENHELRLSQNSELRRENNQLRNRLVCEQSLNYAIKHEARGGREEPMPFQDTLDYPD